MLRRPLVLAALAQSAVPHLRPIAVQAGPTQPGQRYQQVIVVNDDHTEWVVEAALSAGAGAALEESDALLALLAKRVPYAVPRLAGTLFTDEGDLIAVTRRLQGTPLRWSDLEAGSAHARDVGRALAQLHDIDVRVVEEAGLATYDADTYRARRLASLDRAATTGLVPTGLLARWERALEEVTLWKFATCTTHGPLDSGDVLLDDDIVGITGWEAAGVSDPADDFAPLSVMASQDAFDTVFEAYAEARTEAPDAHIERRIRLAAELQRVNALMDAVGAQDEETIERRTAGLRRLDEHLQNDESLMPPTPGPRGQAPGSVEPVTEEPPVDPRDIEIVEVSYSGEDDETVEIPIDQDPPAKAATTARTDEHPPSKAQEKSSDSRE